MRIKWDEQIGKTVNGFKIVDVKREKNRTMVKAICPICGSIFWKRADYFKIIKSCGCLGKTTQFKAKDISGKRFGKLVAIEPTEKRIGTSVVWKCRCSCGNECLVPASSLLSGGTKSCGCIATEYHKNKGKELAKKTQEQCVYGTNIRNLTSKIPKNNKSGVKGVSWNTKRKKWVAQIRFQGKNYYLGRYEKIEDAIFARKEAEEKMFGEFLKWYENERKGEQ